MRYMRDLRNRPRDPSYWLIEFIGLIKSKENEGIVPAEMRVSKEKEKEHATL